MTSEATAGRLLRLLELLQRRAVWSAQELADLLEVTTRSVRRDVDRLRSLGDPVRATSGVGGGYQLGPGGRMPPLLLSDDEAVAVALSLRLASGNAIAGADEAAVRALAKLDQVMPPRLREQMSALRTATDALPRPGTEVDPDLLLALSKACNDTVVIAFGYTSATGEATERNAEPIRLVTTGRRWYLMAWDRDRDDWRTFRLDRITQLEVTDRRFLPREAPDPVAYVQRSVGEAPYRIRVVARVQMSPADLDVRIPPQVGRVETAEDEGWSRITVAADDPTWIAYHLARLGVPVVVDEPEDLPKVAADLAARLGRIC
ncbi:MAG: helix-turn-helix transcriptional regulator [Galactobacter sp.]